MRDGRAPVADLEIDELASSTPWSTSRGPRLPPDGGRDRRWSLVLFGLAGARGWSSSRSPCRSIRSRARRGLHRRGALGLRDGLTAARCFWLSSFARHRRIAYRGDWLRASAAARGSGRSSPSSW
jgi:hypothetical protein